MLQDCCQIKSLPSSRGNEMIFWLLNHIHGHNVEWIFQELLETPGSAIYRFVDVFEHTAKRILEIPRYNLSLQQMEKEQEGDLEIIFFGKYGMDVSIWMGFLWFLSRWNLNFKLSWLNYIFFFFPLIKVTFLRETEISLFW